MHYSFRINGLQCILRTYILRKSAQLLDYMFLYVNYHNRMRYFNRGLTIIIVRNKKQHAQK